MTALLALVSNAGSRFGVWTAQALAGRYHRIVAAIPADCDPAILAALGAIAGVELVIADCTSEAGWQYLAGRPEAAAGAIDLMIHCPHPALGEAMAEDALMSAWLGAKHANPFMAARPGILLVQCLASEPGAVSPELDAAANAMRISMPAALLDAMKAGLSLRSNRLLFPQGVEQAYFQAAVAALTDDRSAFMSGAELALSARRCPLATASARLDGKTILVTGATSGIGRAIAIEIGRLGGWVAVGGRKPQLAEETLAMVRDAGGDGMTVTLDVTDAAAWERAVAAILDARGAVHGLVNNAGEARNRPIAELAAADLSFLTGINYRGCRLGLDHLLAPISASGGGAVVNIASVAGIRAGFGGSAYGGSKAAMIGLSQSYARSHPAAQMVRVNAVQPGLIWSDSVADSLGEAGAASFRAMIEPRTPLGRVGNPEEIGRTVAFLLSDAAAAITGQAITLSGGLELNYP